MQRLFHYGVVYCCLLFMQSAFADSDGFIERRKQVGLKLFRTLVYADLNIKQKSDEQGDIPIVLVYATDAYAAEQLQQQLQQQFSTNTALNFTIKTGSLSSLTSPGNIVPAAVYVSQHLTDSERQQLVAFSIKHEIILFSPFKGDVEQGILAGLSVQSSIRPYLNATTLKQGKYNIKPFYLKVAKYYE